MLLKWDKGLLAASYFVELGCTTLATYFCVRVHLGQDISVTILVEWVDLATFGGTAFTVLALLSSCTSNTPITVRLSFPLVRLATFRAGSS